MARHTTRALGGLIAVFAGATMLFAWSASRQIPPVAGRIGLTAAAAGARLFDAHCAGCHDAAALHRDVTASPDPAARLREWSELLTSHGAASAEEDRAILEYLRDGPGGADAGRQAR